MWTRWPILLLSLLLTGSVLGASTVTGAEDAPSPVATLAAESPSPDASAAPAPDPDDHDSLVAQQQATPWLPPVVETDPSKRIGWPSLSVVFEADDLRIKARGQTFKGMLSAEFIQSWAGLTDRDYDIMWLENGREMRMDITFRSDANDYWIAKWMVYDGRKKNPGWASFKGPLFVTPLDEPMEADVRLTTGKGKRQVELIVDGMRIHAFHPGSGPAPLTDCMPPVPLDPDAIAAQQLAEYRATFTDEQWEEYRKARESRLSRSGLTLEERLLEDFRRQVAMDPVVQPPRVDDGVPFSPGRPAFEDWVEPDHQFKDTGIWTMSLPDAEALLRDSGVCFEFTYSFVDQRLGSAGSIAEERWCTAPPRGELVSLEYREDVIDVKIWDDTVQATRDVPPAGWNCPTI